MQGFIKAPGPQLLYIGTCCSTLNMPCAAYFNQLLAKRSGRVAGLSLCLRLGVLEDTHSSCGITMHAGTQDCSVSEHV
jgi:hypothetical protein